MIIAMASIKPITIIKVFINIVIISVSQLRNVMIMHQGLS